MDIIRISPNKSAAAVAVAAEVIRKGGIVAFPTETYYGLGAAYDNPSALGKLFALKRRPAEKPVPLIAGSIEKLLSVSEPPDKVTAAVIETFWPGPLTLLLPAREGVLRLLTAGTGRVAVRIPGQSFALELARSLESPFTATSANISGRPPADTAEDVSDYFGDRLDLLIDGGRTPGGAPSTIVAISGGTVTPVRKGKIPFELVFEAVTKAQSGEPGA